MAGSVVSMGVVAIEDKDTHQVTAWSQACPEYVCGSDATQNHIFIGGFQKCFKPNLSHILGGVLKG